MTKVKRWTIMRASGATEIFWGPGTANVSPAKDYLDILDWVGRDMMSGGSTYDRPTLLFADGKQVELGKDLTDLGYHFINEKQIAHREATARVNEKYDLEQFK